MASNIAREETKDWWIPLYRSWSFGVSGHSNGASTQLPDTTNEDQRKEQWYEKETDR
jgi:hypothetical protein